VAQEGQVSVELGALRIGPAGGAEDGGRGGGEAVMVRGLVSEGGRGKEKQGREQRAGFEHAYSIKRGRAFSKGPKPQLARVFWRPRAYLAGSPYSQRSMTPVGPSKTSVKPSAKVTL